MRKIPVAKAHAALELSRTILMAAKAGDWDKVVELESTRKSNLTDLFAELQGDQLGVESLSPTLKEIQVVTKEITQLAIDERENARRELMRLQSAQKVGIAYASNLSEEE